MAVPLATTQSTAASEWRLGANVPQTHRRWLRALGGWLMRRAGWRFEGQMPNLTHFVVIVAPHTSNWDFPVGLAAKWALGFDATFWGKDSLFRWPLGSFMRANGGIPVDRRNRSNVVPATIAEFAARPRMALVLSPEGTRKKVDRWRTGFWHVAKGANVPICCVALDWGRRVVQLGPTTMPEEDEPEVGIARMRRYFDGITGYHPHQQG